MQFTLEVGGGFAFTKLDCSNKAVRETRAPDVSLWTDVEELTDLGNKVDSYTQTCPRSCFGTFSSVLEFLFGVEASSYYFVEQQAVH